MFVGYPKGRNGGLFYNPKDNTIKVSNNVTFLEESYMDNFKTPSKLVFKELSGVVEQSPSLILEKVVERLANNQQHRGICHSGRVFKKPKFFIYAGSIYNTEINHEDDDPLTYDEAMQDVDTKL